MKACSNCGRQIPYDWECPYCKGIEKKKEEKMTEVATISRICENCRAQIGVDKNMIAEWVCPVCSGANSIKGAKEKEMEEGITIKCAECETGLAIPSNISSHKEKGREFAEKAEWQYGTDRGWECPTCKDTLSRGCGGCEAVIKVNNAGPRGAITAEKELHEAGWSFTNDKWWCLGCKTGEMSEVESKCEVCSRTISKGLPMRQRHEGTPWMCPTCWGKEFPHGAPEHNLIVHDEAPSEPPRSAENGVICEKCQDVFYTNPLMRRAPKNGDWMCPICWDEEFPEKKDPKDSIASILTEREKRYGNFAEHAHITQALKRVMVNTPKWEDLNYDQLEALEMIAHKIGRILNGDPHYDDSWKDIAGYAKLVADRLAN